jgi:NTP pyrophosphatase (non-canonical NTP hydrolase)
MTMFKDIGMDREWVANLIIAEHKERVKKWGYQEHTTFEWLTYIMEELGELAEAISEYEYRDGILGGYLINIIPLIASIIKELIRPVL